MRPTVKTVDFSSNENGTNSYFFVKNHKLLVQFSWQTCRPRSHFYTRVGLVNKGFWSSYPIENGYDWYYDYHIHNIRLGNVKYYKTPKPVQKLLNKHVIRFDTYTKKKNLIEQRNEKIIHVLKTVCGLEISLNPTINMINSDTHKLNAIIDYIHRKDDERKIVGKYTHTNPFNLNTPKDDIIMRLCGLGFKVVMIMRKIFRAEENNYGKRQGSNVVAYG